MRRLIADWRATGSAPVSSTLSSIRRKSRTTLRSAVWLRCSTVACCSVVCAMEGIGNSMTKAKSGRMPRAPVLPPRVGRGRENRDRVRGISFRQISRSRSVRVGSRVSVISNPRIFHARCSRELQPIMDERTSSGYRVTPLAMLTGLGDEDQWLRLHRGEGCRRSSRAPARRQKSWRRHLQRAASRR